MKDMLVRLVDLPEILEEERFLNATHGIFIKRPIAPEKSVAAKWVLDHFSPLWADEMTTAFNQVPATCLLAYRDNEILGFACFETSAKNFFGPTGVLEHERDKGIGRLLLIKSLEIMKSMGYAYAIIGGVGPESFYQKHVNAVPIANSEISIYKDLIKKKL